MTHPLFRSVRARLLWTAPVTALLTCAAALPALETSLVLDGPVSTGQVVTISPSTGVMNLFTVNDSGTSRENQPANFLTMLELLDKRVVNPPQDGNYFSDLRTGSPNCKPTSIGQDSLLQKLSNKVSDDDKKKNLKSPLDRALAAENKFWAADHPFDGTIRAAFNGQYLMIVVPSRHTLMLYEVMGTNFQLKAWRNYGPELIINQSYNTTPTPQEIFQQLPEEVKQKLKDKDKSAGGDNGGGGGADGGGGGGGGADGGAGGPLDVAETPKSDPWIAVGTNNDFVLLDIPNKVIATYEFTGANLVLDSVRNITYDLGIPTSFASQPDDQQALQTFLSQTKGAKEFMARNGITTDREGLEALVAAGSAQGTGGGDKSGLQGSMDGEYVVLDFTAEHKLLCYAINGPLRMVSARDYTVDVALSLLDKLIDEKAEAHQFIADAKKNFHSHDLALRLLRSALSHDATQVDDVEKDTRLKGELSKEPDWVQIMTDAHKRADEIKAKQEAMQKAAQDARDANKQKPANGN